MKSPPLFSPLLITDPVAGSLGIPNIGLIQLKKGWKEYTFANTEVPSNVEYAFQALALDERRAPFSPTMWEKSTKKNKSLRVLKQVRNLQ